MRHSGKIVLVTGGAKGIGRGCVERFVRDGARVAIADIDSDAAQALQSDLGGAAIAIHCDVTSEAGVERMMAEVVGRFGGLDYAVNNAGMIMVAALAVELAPHRIRVNCTRRATSKRLCGTTSRPASARPTG